jgi:hypothetical protein
MVSDNLTLNEKMLKQRSMGVKGTKILKHRALRSMTLSNSAMQTAILLPIFINVILWFNLDTIAALWSDIISYWMDKLNLGYGVAHMGMKIWARDISIPYPAVPTTFPSESTVLTNLIYSTIFALVSFMLPRVHMPVIYLLRASLLIHGTSVLYFYFWPESFPYDLGSYVGGMMGLGLYLLGLAPVLLALLYYVLDFPLWRKVVVTLAMIAFFIILFPFQYMLYSLMLASWTMLYMPLLYIMFGPLLNTLMFVCWYSCAMTWRSKNTNQ